MPKTDVWMPLYIGDYLADTMHLTTEQHGAYLLLIMAYWRKGGPLPSDPIRLASICGMTLDAWSNAQAMLKQFFDDSTSGVWIHKRVDAELEKSHQKKAKAEEKAKKAAESRWKNATSIASSNQQAMLKECPSPSPSPSHKTNILKHSPDDLAIADMIKSRIESLIPHMKPPNMEKWANCIRLMRESDKRDLEAIRQVFLWANRHSFWSANILSPSKLREKFDLLTAQMGREIQHGQAESGSGSHPRPDNSAAGRVRANIARDRAADAARASQMAMANDVIDVRPQVGEQLRGRSGPGQSMGVVLEGDFERSD